MRWLQASLSVVLGLGLATVGGSASAQSTATKTEVRPFQVVWVEGNKVIVRGEQGSQEITVPDDFRFDVGGKQVSVRELKPGMRGTATITTRTTSTAVQTTEVRDAEVMRVVGNSIIVRDENGIRMFSEADATGRDLQLIRNGRAANFRDLRQGDRLTATIVTSAPPKVVTEREVQATLEAPASRPATRTAAAGAAATAAAAAPRATAAAAAAPADTAAAAPRRTLPRTASPLPLIGLGGASLMAIGFALGVRRRNSHR